MNGTPQKEDSLTVKVADFGPIAKAEVDLRPLTVFVGPSNTGKSYLATLIYALHKFFGGRTSIFRRRFIMSDQMVSVGKLRKPSPKIAESLVEIAKQIIAQKKKESAEDSILLPSQIAKQLSSALDAQGEIFSPEIRRCFGVDDVDSLVRKEHQGKAHIVLQRRSPEDIFPASYELTLGAKEVKSKAAVTKRGPMRIKTSFKDIDSSTDLSYKVSYAILRQSQSEEGLTSLDWELAMDLLTGLTMSQVGGSLCFPAFYLPAARTGVMHAHHVVVSALIENAAQTGILPPPRAPVLSGVLADFLEQLINLGHRSHLRKKRSNGLGEKIEKAILGGSVRVNRSESTGYPRFIYRPDGWKDDLSLMNTSSMVSELAPVVLYLRHFVERNSVLIVEEPESHLHPAMQVKFIRELAALVVAGVRVIITTHSDWLLETLANIVQRSKIPNSSGHGQTGDQVALRPEQVGAWLFQPKGRPKGSVVKEVNLDPETGLYQTDYGMVSEALYNEGISIANRIRKNGAG